MRKDKEEATELRRKGKSYKEISRILGIPTATLCGWFKDLDWSIEIRNQLGANTSFSYPEKLKLMVAATRKKFALLHEEYRQEAIKEFEVKKDDPLFIAGVMLYWGEGDKNVNNSSIRLTNSDLGMIRSFYLFLVNSMGIPKERVTINLLIYPDLIDSVQKKLWSDITGIPLSQFQKSVVIKGRHPTRRLAHGVGMIRIGGRKYKEKLIKWIDLYMREINGKVIA
ncbi:hypothetical protein KKI23_00090 [Patescibacteria group bacterium]|nr:hypothetical protein [Patescibacteria group bacterium]